MGNFPRVLCWTVGARGLPSRCPLAEPVGVLPVGVTPTGAISGHVGVKVPADRAGGVLCRAKEKRRVVDGPGAA